ncbi:MAG: Lycopene cyclase [Spirochaetaceae bacterium]|nr:MAG: Lycopene cyclase [Spirochaetaceae bacterium]
MEHFDYVLAGGGAAGLSLAYHMMHGGLQDKRILIVDPERKDRNDRTWCFWSDRPMLLDPVVAHRWSHFWFHGPDRSHRLKLAPYDYRMIRGIDFYRYVLADLESRRNVSFLRERVLEIEDGDLSGPARVHPESSPAVSADYVFNSLFLARDFRVDSSRYFFLKQHFAGWTIRTEKAVFDPGAATLFDLRVDQKGDFRFMYLLPQSPTESLVEYTLFSSRILPPEEYQEELRDYIRDYLECGNYEILEQEEGIIPMTDQPFPRRAGNRIMNIGTRGGRVKASTGFAFLRTQVDSENIVRNLLDRDNPFHDRTPPRRYATFDSMLLSVLDRQGEGGRDVFVDLFERNPLTRLLRFLDEEGSLGENIRLMASVPWRPFIAAWFRVKWRQWRRGKVRLIDAFGNVQGEERS